MTLLQTAVDSCASSIVIVDETGTIVEINETTERMFGYSKSELVGFSLDILIPEEVRGKHKYHLTKFFKFPSTGIMGDGRAILGLRKDGSTFGIDARISSFDQDGKRYGVANLIDYASKPSVPGLLASTQNIAKIGSWRVDLETNKAIWSKMVYDIHEVDESVEINVEEGINFYVEEHRSIISDCINRCIENLEPWDVELQIVTTSGKQKWVHAIGVALVDDNNQVIGLEGTFRDIDESKILQLEKEAIYKKLEQMNDELMQISYRTSHDLKAPLTTSKRLAQYIIKDIENNNEEEALRNAEKIVKQMVRLEELVSDILELARAELKTEPMDLVNFEEIHFEIIDRLTWMIEESQCRIELSENLKTKVIGEKSRYTQIIENLVSNGIKYRDPNKTQSFVVIEVYDDESTVFLNVKDNGIGIPTENRGDIFTMFKRFHPSIGSGSGLGLSIVKKHVEFLGGTITVHSNAKGTEFKIALPTKQG